MTTNTLVARLEIADGYYLYRDKFKFTIKDPPGVAASAVTIPQGKIKTDEFFGRMEVYYGQAQATVELQADVTANDARDRELLQALRLFGPPAILFFGANGAEKRPYRVVGYMNAGQFRSHINKAFGSHSL